MLSSVSSECTFSQGGITISKQQNWLKRDIVEALQCVKCAIWHDLLFQEPGPFSILEVEVNNDSKYSDDGNGDDEGSETAEDCNDLLLEEGWNSDC